MEQGCQSEPPNSRWHRYQEYKDVWDFSWAPGPPGCRTSLGKGKEAGNAWRLEVAEVRRLPGDLRKGPRPCAPLCVTLSHCCPMGPGLFSPALLRAEIQQGLPG